MQMSFPKSHSITSSLRITLLEMGSLWLELELPCVTLFIVVPSSSMIYHNPFCEGKKNISMSPIFKISTFCQQRNVPNFFVIQALWSSIYYRNVTYLASQCSVFSKPHPHLTCHVHTSFFNWRTYSISTLPDTYNMAFYILYLVAF